jgi:tetratricopeptide (TPR) repeat protein
MVKQDIYKLLQECTVRLSTDSGIGTGFFIAPGGWILTCYHVVDQSDRVEVLWLNGEEKQELTATVRLRLPIPVDIALLQLQGKTPVHKCVFLDRTLPQIGDTLYTFGFPQGYSSENYSGGDSATTNYEGKSFQDGVLILKLKEGQIQEGYSGSPLLNVQTGKVCGIVSISRDTGSDLGGRATPIPLLFQPKGITASPDEQQLILSQLQANEKFHQKIDQQWTHIVNPPFWSRKSVVVSFLSIISLLAIGLPTWRWLNPWEMPIGSYNVAITDFAKINQKGQLERSKQSKILSQWVGNILEKEKNQAESFDTANWNISSPNQYYIPANSIAEFKKKVPSFAKNTNADLLIYGYFNETERLSDKILTMGFYISPVDRPSLHSGLTHAFDIFNMKGLHQIGKNITIKLNNKGDIEDILSSRVKPLFWLIAGLNYSTNKQNQTRALTIFQQAEKNLDRGWSNGEGKEVFYFCMGQVALFYANSPKSFNISLDVAKRYAQQAENAFEKALKSNNEYIRPRIGLGSVHLTRAEWYYDEIDEIDNNSKNVDAKKISQLHKKRDAELNAAIASYEEAVKQLPQSQPDTWSEYAAPLGLGYAWYLKGNIDFDLNQSKKAEEWQKQAVEITHKLIKPLTMAEEYRLLAQTYSNLGLAYLLRANIHLDREDKKTFLILTQQASEAFLLCKKQGEKSQNDYILNENIVNKCEENIQAIAKYQKEI